MIRTAYLSCGRSASDEALFFLSKLVLLYTAIKDHALNSSEKINNKLDFSVKSDFVFQ